MPNKKIIFENQKIRRIIRKKDKKAVCRHDYKNAIKVGNVDYQCPLCGKLLDPGEWFFMNSFEFVEVFSKNTKSKKLFKHKNFC
ncbi:MAG: hypothetical protein ABIG90_01360 [bacterium]